MTFELESLMSHAYNSDEEEPIELIMDDTSFEVAAAAIQRLVETFQQASEARQLVAPPVNCCHRYNKVIAASLLGLIAMIAASVWVPMAVKNELEDHILSHALSKSRITKICLEGFGVTFGSHVLGQITTWVTEYLSLQKPLLSLQEYGLFCRSLCHLRPNGNELYDVDLYNNGKEVFWQETKTYVRDLSHLLILGLQAMAFYFIWEKTGALVASNFESKQTSYDISDIRNITVSLPESHLCETITQTFSLGIFTGAICPVTAIILRVIFVVFRYFRSMEY